MVRGLKLKELKARLELDHNLDEYVLLEVEGEMLAYHKVYDKEMIKCYDNLKVDLGFRPSGADNSDFKAHKSSHKDCFNHSCKDRINGGIVPNECLEDCKDRKRNPS